MKQNGELQRDVLEAIKWEPLLNAAEIGVTVKDGVVTLSGKVDSYAKKAEAEEATRNVSGVKAVIEKIEVQFNELKLSDEQIVRDILKAFKWTWRIPNGKIKVEVAGGWVTLFGEVERNAEREAAKKIVHDTAGVKGITNDIIIKSDEEDKLEKGDIQRALSRNWAFDNTEVGVDVTGNSVTLKGTVHSLYQKDEASRIAWNAPGVWNVDNEIMIES